MSKKTQIQTIHAGAGRGARLMLPPVRDFNLQSERFFMKPLYVDPIPGRADEVADEASRLGVFSTALEAKVEDSLMESRAEDSSAVVLQIDRPTAVAKAITCAAEYEKPVLQYMLLRVPDGNLYGIRMAFQSNENAEMKKAVKFYERLAEVTARSGHSMIVGEEGRSEHLIMEPSYRAWFGNHMKETLPKIVTGLEPDSHPIEMTPDGRRTLWVTIHDSGSSWSDPRGLAFELAERPSMPLIRGQEFMIAELGPKGLRLHQGSIRRIDGKLAIHGTSVVTEQTMREAEALRRETELALQRAVRQTISLSQPAFTTD